MGHHTRQVMAWPLFVIAMLVSCASMAQSGRAVAHMERGNELTKSGEFAKAIESYTKAIEIQPDYHAAYWRRGVIYYDLAEFQLAISDYNAADSLVPGQADLHMNRGNAYSRLGLHDRALADHQRAMMLGYRSPDTLLYNIANNHWRMGNTDSALVYYAKVLEINPGLKEAKGNRAYVFLLQNRYVEAATGYKELLREFPDDVSYLNNLGYAELRLDDLESAMVHVQRSVDLDAKNAFAYRNRGLIHMAMSKHKEACADLKRAIQLDFVKQWGSAELSELVEYCKGQ